MFGVWETQVGQCFVYLPLHYGWDMIEIQGERSVSDVPETLQTFVDGLRSRLDHLPDTGRLTHRKGDEALFTDFIGGRCTQSAAEYDFQSAEGLKVELKVQQGCQWLDAAKLSDHQVVFVFAYYRGPSFTEVAVLTYDDVMRALARGLTQQEIEWFRARPQASKIQTKAPLDKRDVLECARFVIPVR